VGNGEPILIVNPRRDDEFVLFVLNEFRGGAESAEAFETRLRTRYPRASVRERGLAGEAQATWYVYREGKWTTSDA
jgi:hypothetical protein